MKNIYILSEKKFDGAKNLPVIKINFLNPKVDFTLFDALIFTSKNAVEAVDRLNNLWKNKEIYSIGVGTSSAIKEKGTKPVFTATNSYGDDFAQEILPFLKNKKVLFLRAKIVTSNLNNILKNEGISLDEKVVYETVCNDKLEIKPISGSIIIFSSPSTIDCFFKRFDWNDSFKAVVIGKKTASYMPKNIKYILSDIQTIPSCIELAKNLL